MESWGRYPRVRQTVRALRWRDEPLDLAELPVLPRGRGRSYGDSCLNADGVLLSTAALDRLISFDEATGVLRCESGMTLGDILAWSVPRGWFLPVLPGTKHVSVGGAIANDIHGKNHHVAGTFGRHVQRLELSRSEGSRRELTPADALFQATVGGLGLTGLVNWAEVRLIRVPGPCMLTDAVPFDSLGRFLELTAESDGAWDYTVAWIDCLSQQPLDSVEGWNRIYGARGFFQFQCVVPRIETIGALLRRVAASGGGSFLSVLKTFGDLPSPGMLSFPRRGFTLALDFANRGPSTLSLLGELEREVAEAGGCLYPAKDALMSRASFLRGAPRLAEFAPHVDPAFSSSFWRRVSA